MQYRWCSLVLVLTCAVLQRVIATGYEQPFCTDLKPQNTLDLGQIMGMWYGVEIIPHLREEDGVIVYDTCPVIHLSETTYEPSGQGYERSGSYSPTSYRQYDRSGSYSSTGQGQYDRSNGYSGTGQGSYDRSNSYSGVGQGQYGRSNSYSGIGQGQYDRSNSYSGAGQGLYDRSNSYSGTGQGQYDRSSGYLSSGQGQYDRSDSYSSNGYGLYGRTSRLGTYAPGYSQSQYDNSGSYLSSQGQYGRSGSYPLATTDNYVRPGDYGYNWNGGGGGFGSSSYGDKEYRHLRLYWDEAGNNIEYSLKFNNTRRGFWISSGPQNGQIGTLLERKYNQFAGTVQVMKAVGDHLVLTFCQRLPESQLFSVILSREPQQLGRQVVHSIHNLLNRRDLSTSAVRKVCRNGSPGVDASLGTMAAFTLVAVIAYFGAGHV